MKLIVGLGNPELRYFATRHNAGFWVVDYIATKYGAQLSESKNLFAYVAKVHTNNNGPLVLAQPSTYMNLSGKAVQAIAHWYKIELSNVLVIHDDVSLPLGKLRVQAGGGAGGQHGIEDIIRAFGGNKNFDRIKFGVGPDPGGDRRADFVLSPVPEDMLDIKKKMIELSADAAHMWMTKGAKDAANKYNGLDLRPIPPAPPPPPPAPPSQEEKPPASLPGDALSGG